MLTQGQEIYKSKQVRDKQIARILGKVCLFLFFTWTFSLRKYGVNVIYDAILYVEFYSLLFHILTNTLQTNSPLDVGFCLYQAVIAVTFSYHASPQELIGLYN